MGQIGGPFQGSFSEALDPEVSFHMDVVDEVSNDWLFVFRYS